jgi:hypothetical protein
MIKTTAIENTLLVEARISPADIAFINILIEEYEGLAVMRTIDRHQGLLKFWVPETRKDLMIQVCEDFVRHGWLYEYRFVDAWWNLP